jgi:hypothetical protein
MTLTILEYTILDQIRAFKKKFPRTADGNHIYLVTCKVFNTEPRTPKVLKHKYEGVNFTESIQQSYYLKKVVYKFLLANFLNTKKWTEDVSHYQLLSLEQEHYLIGHLLGDGNLESTDFYGVNARFKFIQKTSSIDYATDVMEIFKNYLGSDTVPKKEDPRIIGPTIINRTVNNVTLSSARFHTRNSPIFGYYFQQWYKQMIINDKMRNIKIVPNSLENLSIKSIAVWFNDVGCASNGGGPKICTDAFTFSEIERLCGLIQKSIRIDTTIIKQASLPNVTYRICINGQENADKFRLIIRPYMHKSMVYRLDNKSPLKRNPI